jgi:acetoacetyl-CoA synthetase
MSSQDEQNVPEKLWAPQDPGKSSMDTYRLHVNQTYNLNLRTSSDLHRWSVESPHEFWIDLYSWLGLTPSLPPGIQEAYKANAPISSNPPFFADLEGFNYAENAMFANPDPQAIALIGVREDTDLDNGEEELLTWSQFRDKVRLTASALRRCGMHASNSCGVLQG